MIISLIILLIIFLIGSVTINIVQHTFMEDYKEIVKYYREKSQKHFSWYLEVLDKLDNQETKQDDTDTNKV